MKKRMLSTLLAVVMVVSMMSGVTFTASAAEAYSGGSGSADDPYILSSADDLVALHTALSNDDGTLDATDECGLGAYHGYYFKLSGDIDMEGVAWTPISFCGNLDGADYTIHNLSVTEADNGSGEYWAGMFGQLVNATVSNITFENCTASVSAETSSSRDIYVAIVAANAIASKLENITVVDSTVTQNGYAKNMGYAAFVAALADISNITGCVVEGGELSSTATTTNPMNVGGITGCFEDLYWEFIADYGNPYNMAIGAGSDYGIFDCYVNADLTVDAGSATNVAGIVGMTCTDYLDNTEEFAGVAAVIKNCVYRGAITAVKGSASGISDWDEPKDQIIDCVSLATLSAPKTNVLGELTETVTNCYYLADIADETGGRTETQFADGSVCAERDAHFAANSECTLCGIFCYEVTLATVDGAQMRTREPQGLRFTSSIAKSGDFDKVTEYGTILIPTADLTDISELVIGATLNGREVAKVEAVNKYAEDDTSVTFTAVIIDIKEKNYTRSYTARAYAILEDGSVVYGDTYASRSIYQIAQAILADENASAEDKAAAQVIVDTVAAQGDNDLSEPWQ